MKRLTDEAKQMNEDPEKISLAPKNKKNLTTSGLENLTRKRSDSLDRAYYW
jgi:hypothetical protein